MKDFLSKFFKNPIVIVLLIVSIFWGMPALTKASQINENSIVIGVGIDLSESGEKKYDVSFLTFLPVPEQNFNETYKVVSAQGDSIAEASNFAGVYLGRKLRFSHMKTIVLSQDVLGEDVPKLLDFLARGSELSGSTKIVAIDDKASKFFSVVQGLDSESSIKISELASHNHKEVYAVDATLEKFFKGYLGPTKVSLIPVFSLTKDDANGLAVSGEMEQSPSSKASEKATQKESSEHLINSGDAAVFKDGKYVTTLSVEQMKNINWMTGEFSRGIIQIDDFQGKEFKGMNLTFEVFDNKMNKKVIFENGTPVVYMNPRINVVLAEVEKDGMLDKNVEFYTLYQDDFAELEHHIKSYFADALQTMRENKTDICDFYTLIHNADKKKFCKFMNSLEDREDYLSYVVFKVGVKVRTR